MEPFKCNFTTKPDAATCLLILSLQADECTSGVLWGQSYRIGNTRLEDFYTVLFNLFFFFSSEKDPFLFAGLLPFGSVPNAVIEVESRRYQWNSSANASALLPFSYISSDFYVEGIKRWGVGYFSFQDLSKQSLWKPSCLTLWEAVWEVNRSQLSFCFSSDFYCFFCCMEGHYQFFIDAISSVEL